MFLSYTHDPLLFSCNLEISRSVIHAEEAILVNNGSAKKSEEPPVYVEV